MSDPLLVNGFPRRKRIDLTMPVELALRSAVEKIESIGCDPLLTKAIIKVEEARELVAYYIERERETMPRLAVGVSVIITQGTRLLLGRRKNNHDAGLLSTPGGRLELDEGILDCAVREVFEETDAMIKYESLSIEKNVIAWREHFRYGDHYIMFYLHVDHFYGEIKNKIPDKNESWDWVEITAIKMSDCTEPGDILAEVYRRITKIETATIAPKETR